MISTNKIPYYLRNLSDCGEEKEGNGLILFSTLIMWQAVHSTAYI